MYARLSLMSLGPRAGSRDVAEKLADIFRPVCMEQRGIVDATFIIGNTENGNAGEYVSLSVWKTKADAEQAAKVMEPMVDKYLQDQGFPGSGCVHAYYEVYEPRKR